MHQTLKTHAFLLLPALLLSACAAAPERAASSSAASTAVSAPAAAGATTGIDGNWKGSILDPQGSKHSINVTFKLEGNAVTGTLAGGPPDGRPTQILDGKLEGDQLTFTTRAQGSQGEMIIHYQGKLSGNRIEGVHGMRDAKRPFDLTKQ